MVVANATRTAKGASGALDGFMTNKGVSPVNMRTNELTRPDVFSATRATDLLENANAHACLDAARAAGLTPDQAHACKNGEQRCRSCPWKFLVEPASLERGFATAARDLSR
jgi:hypothetical protein